jgi:bla regulator protein BlaR1
MACPVLGEKSIIHRLRCLTMSDVSSTRRKAGLAVIAGGALVALPLTASVSYAADEEPATTADPQQVTRFELQREGEEAEAPSATNQAAPPVRRQFILSRTPPAKW